MDFLLAQADKGPGFTEYSAGAVALMLLAALLWFMRHVVTVMIPAIIAESSNTAVEVAKVTAGTAANIAELGRATTARLTEELAFARAQYAESLKEERALRHAERNVMNAASLKMSELLALNTAETTKLVQETRALTVSVGNLTSKGLV